MNHTDQSLIRQFLTFRLGKGVYSIDVVQVREILDHTDITQVPQTPDYMLGVINLRGNVVPVIDMRRRFGLPTVELTRDSCIIVMEVHVEGEMVVVGALADAVEEVLDMKEEEIEPAPRLGNHVNAEFLQGVGRREEQFVMILDIDKIFAAEEVDFYRPSTESEAVGE